MRRGRHGDVTRDTKQVKLKLRPEVGCLSLPFWAQLFLY